MSTVKITWNGKLRSTCRHIASGSDLITDAPKDNHGKGESFSPTDLLATSLGSCILTIIGIKANKLEKPLQQAEAEIEKIMKSNPRKVGELHINLRIKSENYTERELTMLENAGRNCPVALSLHPDIKQKLSFEFYS